MQTDFAPIEKTRLLLQKWWWIVLAMLAGGLAALAFARLEKPVFEADIPFGIVIDYGAIGNLTEIEQEYVLDSAEAAVYDPAIAQEVSQKAQAEGYNVSAEALWRSARIERQGFTLLVRIRQPEEELASKFAAIWAEVASQRLVTAHENASQVRALNSYLRSLETCLYAPYRASETSDYCPAASLDELKQEYVEVGKQLHERRAQSLGLLPEVTIQSQEEPLLPARRIDRNGLWAAAGVGIGFLFGILTLPAAPHRKK